MNTRTLEQARAAKKQVKRVYKPFAVIVGVGLTRVDQGYGLKVNIQDLLGSVNELPSEIDGVPVKLEVIGRIQKRHQPKA